jgi:hypothetical protein
VTVDAGPDADHVRTGWGKDEVGGGTGADVISTGRQRDFVDAADGERDVVNCGKGRDRVRADELDRVTNCEIREP